MRAFRFWLIVSSTAVRDTRRKSTVLAHEREFAHCRFVAASRLTSERGLIEAELRREPWLLWSPSHDSAMRCRFRLRRRKVAFPETPRQSDVDVLRDF